MPQPLVLALDELPGRVGAELGPTAWRTLGQDAVDEFAALTEDHNPIHVDPAHAAGTRFGGPIVHGYFSLALLAPLFGELIEVRGAGLSVNYGLDRVRFPGPLPVGAEFRASGRIDAVREVEGGAQLELELTVEVRDQERPALVARCLSRFYDP
jgi:acyl dehydratase